MIAPDPNRRIHLNTATSEELSDLPGIGPDKAWDIMEHRPYASWEDVARVPGLSKETVEVMKRNGAVLDS